METTNEKNRQKPEWLQALESQSWQAELIASGLAIYGSVYLGPILHALAENMIPMFNDRVLQKLNYVFIYLLFAQHILVASFIGHLILRIVWAGFLGLSSVYPNGIDTERKSIYTASFLKKLKLEFNDLSQYSIKLDEYSSLVFSVLCTIVLFLLSFSVWISVFIGFSELLIHFLGNEMSTMIIYSFSGLVLSLMILLSLLTTGKFKNSQYANKYAYKINSVFTRILVLFAYKPFSYILWTLRTNASIKQFMVGMIIIVLPFAFLTAVLNADLISNFLANKYFSQNSTVSQASKDNYIDGVNSTSKILKMTIQSREIEENYIKLFIPKMKRDEFFKYQLCGQPEIHEDLSYKEKKLLKEKHDLECVLSYYKIKIDNNKYPNPNFEYIKHEHNNEKGYLTYLRIDTLQAGNHILQIETGYKNEKGENAVRLIPFYKTN